MDDLTRLRLLGQLKRDEGKSAVMYLDSANVPTIGYGHNLTVPISEAAMEQILSDDLAAAEADVASLVWTTTLSPCRFAVLVAMRFNLGFGGLLGFVNMLAALRSGDYETAAREALNSLWASQVGARADRLAEQMRRDRWLYEGPA